jgi:DNA-binding response OmpR family regulator
MKILVADDDNVAQRILRAVLEREKHSVLTVGNGEEALKLLLQPEAPHVAVLDWMMPGLNGPDICMKLRAANLKIRPHVIMLSAKTEKSELASALDAGADDFLSKPFNQMELLARLRVAGRMIQSQLELQQQLNRMEALTQRYQMLGEIVVGQSNSPTTETANKPGANGSKSPARFSLEAINAAILQTLSGFNEGPIETEPASPSKSAGTNGCVAWVGMILPGPQLWIDLLLEGKPEAVAQHHVALLRRPPTSDRDALRFFAEKHTLISSALKTALQGENEVAFFPILSRAMRVGQYTTPCPRSIGEETSIFTFADHSLRLQATVQACPITYKEPRRLNQGEILAEAFPPPAVTSIPLLNQGMPLNERYIEKIMAFADSGMPDLRVPVFRATPLATYFSKYDVLAGNNGL